MNSVLMTNFRCFGNDVDIPVHPLTILIGENSTGKTSFLAAVALADSLLTGASAADFNREPFLLGAYDEIAHFPGGRFGRAKNFSIGSRFFSRDVGSSHEILHRTTFDGHNGQPRAERVELSDQDFNLTIFRDEDFIVVKGRAQENGREIRRALQDFPSDVTLSIPLAQSILASNRVSKADDKVDEDSYRLWRYTYDALKTPGRIQAIAPIRAQPRRTYEVLSDAPMPQGQHVPMLLSQLYSNTEWELLRKPLESFASASGMFDHISVKALGRQTGSPFQIQVHLGGPKRNLIDIGYGVSQFLPLLVELLKDSRPSTLLVQQPEVHLHPRAQAELGSLFVWAMRHRRKTLIIETHSDYIVDRIRLEIRAGKLGREQAGILYFEREKGGSRISQIIFDERGDLVDAPASYREFFLRHEEELLGI